MVFFSKKRNVESYEEENITDEDDDEEEENIYDYDFGCENCNNEETHEIPMGKTVREFLTNKKCET